MFGTDWLLLGGGSRPSVWDFLLVPEEVESVKTIFTELRAERSHRFANYWLTKTGERRWITWSNTLIRHPDGRIRYIINTGIDRTESKRVENALRTSEKEREFLAKVGAILVATLDYDEILTSIARVVVENLADCCAMDLVDRDGTPWRMKVVHRDAAKAKLCERLQRLVIDRQRPHLVSSVLKSRQPTLIAEVSSQYLESVAQSDEHLRAMQELAPRSLMVVPLLVHGELLGALSLISTHPSRRYGPEDLRLAEELGFCAALAIENARLYASARSHSDDLREANQQMVSATIRAHELTEEAEAAKQRAEMGEHELREAAEFREMFIGILGHDLRTPLGAISLTAATLRRYGHLDEHDEKALARIANSAERMRRMISQLLELTRARLGGGFPLESKPTDLRVVCRSVLDEFVAPSHLEVEGDVTGAWDPDRLQEALSNIVGNAVEHAAPGTPVVLKVGADSAQVFVEISNQGNPIPPDVLPFIFEPFRRAKQHERSATGSLGLGLYIANQIVLSHGGTLSVDSRSGTTTFVMRLPRGDRAGRSGRASVPQVRQSSARS